jgi:hypothetical protein
MTEDVKEKLAEITKRSREESNMTLAAFGSYLCERIPGISQSKQNIFNWESGTQAVPEYFALLVYAVYAETDMRYIWALQCLRAINPDAWGDKPMTLSEA